MYYFVSDLHLGFLPREEDRLREDLFLKLLSEIKDDCETLFLVGDIFDYWFEYNSVVPAPFYRTLAVFDDYVQSGKKIVYIMGNHDFGHTHFFKNVLGIDVLTSDFETVLHNKKFYIAHGDGKAKNDFGYLVLRAILRNKLSKWLFKWIHPDVGIWLATLSSKKSRAYTDQKEYGSEDGLKDFASEMIKSGQDIVVMGHRHLASYNKIDNGLYVNLGEWFKKPMIGIFDGIDFQLEEVYTFFDKKGIKYDKI